MPRGLVFVPLRFPSLLLPSVLGLLCMFRKQQCYSLYVFVCMIFSFKCKIQKYRLDLEVFSSELPDFDNEDHF